MINCAKFQDHQVRIKTKNVIEGRGVESTPLGLRDLKKAWTGWG